MDLDYFLSVFQSRFPDRHAFRRDDAVIVAGACPEIGEIHVFDHGDEFTVSVGDFTHGHFNPYNDSLTAEQALEVATQEVIVFLSDVFANQVEFYRRSSGGGGWRPAGQGPEESFTWSGRVG